MISYDTKLKLKELLICFAEEEIAIEKLRQMLAAIKEFEPYAVFKRIDRENTGFLSSKSLCQFIRENGFRELTQDDFYFLIRYFDQDDDQNLNYHDFLQVLLPCDDAVLRAAASQRPTYELRKYECLPMRVERAVTQLLLREVKFHMKAENIKRTLESSYDFSVQGAFKCIDDWNYGYIDNKNLRRFLRNMGHLASKKELISIIRRFDTDGDAKVNLCEFTEGIKSQLSQSNPFGTCKKTRSQSKMNKNSSNKNFNILKANIQEHKTRLTTPKKRENSLIGTYISNKKRPQSANKVTGNKNNRKQLIKQMQAESTPSKFNKSVTFNSQVRVREYDSATQKQNMTPTRITQSFDDKFDRYTPSPLRNQERIDRALDFSAQQINLTNASPLRPSLKNSNEKQMTGYSQNNGSPLIVRHQSPQRFSLEQSQEKIRPYQQPQQKEENVIFDRIEQGEVAKIFKDTIFLERELESAKIELILKPDFNLLDAFRMLDENAKGCITSQDLLDSLKRTLQIDTPITQDDISLVLKRYDVRSKGNITFNDFCDIVSPLSKEYATLLTGRQEFYSVKRINNAEYFNPETRNEYRNFWKAIFQNERATECLRARISKRLKFSMKSAFIYTDKDLDGMIAASDIRNMLAEHGFFATERELNSIMNKFDKDHDQRISFSEFIDELTPKMRY